METKIVLSKEIITFYKEHSAIADAGDKVFCFLPFWIEIDKQSGESKLHHLERPLPTDLQNIIEKKRGSISNGNSLYELLKDEHIKLKEEFDAYKKASVKYTLEDFRHLQVPGFTITKEQAEAALNAMLTKHEKDRDTLIMYYKWFGTPIETK